jgi:hypothetical protein
MSGMGPPGGGGSTLSMGGGGEGMGQGLTLVHFSAQLEPILTQKHTKNTPYTL